MDGKSALRSRLRAARSLRTPSELAQAAASIARYGADLCRGAATVAAYAAIRDEPPTRALLDRLVAQGSVVLLPVVRPDGLEWARYDAWPELTRSSGLLEPTGDTHGADALFDADVVLAPALAVDLRGHRLGRGGGHYDRALVGIPREHIVAVVFADEVLDDVPADAHDIPVRAALTPAGVVDLGEPTAS